MCSTFVLENRPKKRAEFLCTHSRAQFVALRAILCKLLTAVEVVWAEYNLILNLLDTHLRYSNNAMLISRSIFFTELRYTYKASPHSNPALISFTYRKHNNPVADAGEVANQWFTLSAAYIVQAGEQAEEKSLIKFSSGHSASAV